MRSYGNTRKLSDYQQSFIAATNGNDEHNSKQEMSGQSLKILIGSVGSKSNKVVYVREIIRFLSENPNLSKSVIWTPAATRVASLYSAADVYVTNSQVWSSDSDTDNIFYELINFIHLLVLPYMIYIHLKASNQILQNNRLRLKGEKQQNRKKICNRYIHRQICFTSVIPESFTDSSSRCIGSLQIFFKM